MKIIEIINRNHCFGFGQLSHNPREYCNGYDADIILGAQIAHVEPDAIIRTDKGDISVYNHEGFCCKIDLGNGWGAICEKRLSNTASPECICEAVEEQLRIRELSLQSIPRPLHPLRVRRKAARLTQQQLSDMSGVHQQVIVRLELRERDIASASYATIMRLSTALQCRPEKIVSYSDYADYPLDT